MNNKTIRVKLGSLFKISLDSNPTTGYQWEVNFNRDYIQLKSRNFVSSNSKLGGGGREHFSFKPLKLGKATITLQYMRSWEHKTIKKEKFIIEII
ncbi:MAG: protease inhibitor I42 family protein [Candidatus Thorarchaeota archaeon]